MSDQPARLYRFHGAKKPTNSTRTPVRAAAPPARQGDDGVVTLRLYEPIDSWGEFWGVSALEFARVMDELPAGTSEIRLLINSPGGEVFDALAIMNQLRNHPAKVVAIVEGLAASAASFIAVSADELHMSPNSQLMIHDASGFAMGPASVMHAFGDELDQISDNIADVYARKTGGEKAAMRTLMLAETWFTAEEAVTAGLADSVLGEDDDENDDSDAAATNRWDLSLFAHAGRQDAPAPAAALAATRSPAASAAGTTPPAAPASGDTPPKGDAAVDITDEQLTTMRQRLGVAADADVATIIAALEEALNEQTSPTGPVPAGMRLVDEAALAALQADSAAGRQAREQQVRDEQHRLVDEAVRDGRIPPSRREHWQNLLAADNQAAETLASLAKGTVPVDELGHAEQLDTSADDATYARLFPEEVAR